MKKIKVKILKESCGPAPESMMQTIHVPEIGIHPEDEPCGCPDMAHNHGNNEGSMSRSQLMHMRNYAEELMQMISDHDDLPEWVELKITLANDYIAKVKHYLEGELYREKGMLENKNK